MNGGRTHAAVPAHSPTYISLSLTPLPKEGGPLSFSLPVSKSAYYIKKKMSSEKVQKRVKRRSSVTVDNPIAKSTVIKAKRETGTVTKGTFRSLRNELNSHQLISIAGGVLRPLCAQLWPK